MRGIEGRHIIELAKVTEYLLSDTHPTGKAKAAFFTRFGFTRSNPNAFMLALDAHARWQWIVRTTISNFSVKREVRCNLTTPDGRNPCIVAVWIQEGEGTPHRLITAYPSDL